MADAPKKKILIAEDERPMARALELKLQHEGYDVVVTFDGGSALDALGKIKFDLLLLDIIMPIKDGFQVLEAMQGMPERPPVLMLTNLSQEEDAKKASALGAKGFFTKSNTPLANIVDEVKAILK